MRIVAGDVGGTKTLLQLLDVTGEERHVLVERRYESANYPTFDAMLQEFVAIDRAPIAAGCFAVAGPVLEHSASVTNLGWKMESAALASAFSIDAVVLINDFYAVALGVPLLAENDLLPLNKGSRVARAPIAILGAGTGLGEAALIFDDDKWNVIPSEGGHADFAPQNREQAELFVALHDRYEGHVSWERLLSGMGLVNIFTFLREHRFAGDTAHRDLTIEDENLPARIAELASEGDPLAVATFEMFVDIYGAEAGNMALRFLSRGGVYLAGGVAAKNPTHFTNGRFLAAFLRKGRFDEMLRQIPVNLITNAKVGLLGAVEMAARTARRS